MIDINHLSLSKVWDASQNTDGAVLNKSDYAISSFETKLEMVFKHYRAE